MPLVSASMHPDRIVLQGGFGRVHAPIGESPINGTSSAYDIEHRHGNVTIEVRNGNLFFGLPIREDITPSITATASWHRSHGGLFYPEVLFNLTGHVELSRP
jgi:hypothetical protein